MSINKLLDFIGKQNIAEEIPDDKLEDIGRRVKETYDLDWQSMKDWCEQVDNGLNLMKQEYYTKSHPWEGASNFKSPLLSESAIAFGDKASLEILRAKNLVKADVIGNDSSPASEEEMKAAAVELVDQFMQEELALARQLDSQTYGQRLSEGIAIVSKMRTTGNKKELSDRITTAMNYQINYDMKGWRKEQKRMLYILPNIGTVFKKTVFDPLKGRVASHTIQYPDFAVNQAVTDLSESPFTTVLPVDVNGMHERVAAGIWRDVDIFPENADGSEGSNADAQTTDAMDNPCRFLEQQCFIDLDEDGYEEPYTVTFHEQTSEVLRIVPRYTEQSFIVKTPEGRVLDLVEAIKQDAIAASQRGEPLPEVADINKFDLVRIEGVQEIIKYGFIPSPDGTFLDHGYSHLLGAITQGVNSTTNQLSDAGILRNMGGGFLAKGFRKKMGPIRFRPGQYSHTDMDASKLQTSILPNPAPEPSSVLFALNEKLEQQGRQFAATVDISGQIQANTAPTTALAIIQESLVSTSALMGRVLDSMSEEFQVIYDLNKRTFDPEMYKNILDDQGADALADFNHDGLDIIPTANPEMSSKLQRIQLSTVEIEQIPNVIQAGGNPMPIIKGFFENIGSDKVDEVFPEQPTDQQAAEMKRFADAQEAQNQIAAAQLEHTQLQTQILLQEQERLAKETEIKRIDGARKIQETASKTDNLNADTLLKLEQAESEDVKNRVSVYTAEVKATNDTIKAIGEEDARRENQQIGPGNRGL